MPKLSNEWRATSMAVYCLLELYKDVPEFRRELNELRAIYQNALLDWLRVSIPSWWDMKQSLSAEQLDEVKDFFLVPSKDISDELMNKVNSYLPHLSAGDLLVKLEEYEQALHKLSYRWKLKASWAGHAWVIDHANDLMMSFLSDEAKKREIPVEIVEQIMPTAPLPKYRFEVSAFEFMFSSRKEMQNRFNIELAEYERQLKEAGWQEVPSALEKHAWWWFEHYVRKKEYKQLEREAEAMGDYTAREESIRRAVFNLRKKLNIKLR
jgi:hypothetical protein